MISFLFYRFLFFVLFVSPVAEAWLDSTWVGWLFDFTNLRGEINLKCAIAGKTHKHNISHSRCFTAVKFNECAKFEMYYYALMKYFVCKRKRVNELAIDWVSEQKNVQCKQKIMSEIYITRSEDRMLLFFDHVRREAIRCNWIVHKNEMLLGICGLRHTQKQ